MPEIYDASDAFLNRPPGPRRYRALRQRRSRSKKLYKEQHQKSRTVGWEGVATMDEASIIVAEDPETNSMIERTSLCLPNYDEDRTLHAGEKGFKEALTHYFPSLESNASERLVVLKQTLRTASTYDFWAILLEEMCDILDTQCGFVVKRILVDDQDSAVEMPELGDPGSCLLGIAVYVNEGNGTEKSLSRDYKYLATGTACEHMQHNKVCIIPERVSEFLPNQPNHEAFIGIPLYSEGKCFAHFGLTWSKEGAARRVLSWNFVEMFLHSLEDMVVQRIVEGRGFAKDIAPPESLATKMIPLSAITASQSLKPYARSLSHELRTPMQGVVGMLDIMYATVLDAIINQQSTRVKEVFTDLKNHIEVVQVSSRRAVEAADNVVHAYNHNMQMPDGPLTPSDPDTIQYLTTSSSQAPNLMTPSSLLSPMSRKHELVHDEEDEPPFKRACSVPNIEPMNKRRETMVTELEVDHTASMPMSPLATPPISSSHYWRVSIRDFIGKVVDECLHGLEVYTSPESRDVIEVKSVGPRGERQTRTINLNIHADVPEAVITEEHHLRFSIQKVVDNALKFTESGSITITVMLSKGLQMLEIWIIDTGCGIADESKSSLFTPHFQENGTRSRMRDGLGLSLFNAKAHVRKNLGGDLTLERSATSGFLQGSEFLIRLPLTASNAAAIPILGNATLLYNPSQNSSWRDPGSLGEKTTADRPSSLSGSLAKRLVTPKQPLSKRSTHNPHLAAEYPLNILIAEDNIINQKVALGFLKKLGYSTNNLKLACDGVEAVNIFTESLTKPKAQQFDVILMDIWMPNMDGYEASSKILEVASRHNVVAKIIAVTADITGECMEKAKEVGMRGFLAKPFQVLDMENLIMEHFTT